MNEQEKGPEHVASRCLGCGRPLIKDGFCRECSERGLGPCEACEGLSLLEVEENAS
jgi:hypothetical protein